MKNLFLILFFTLCYLNVFAQCEIKDEWLTLPRDSFWNKTKDFDYNCFYGTVIDPYNKHYCFVNKKNYNYDPENKFKNTFMLKDYKKIDSITWAVTQYLSKSKEEDIVNRDLNYPACCGMIFPIGKDTTKFDKFLFFVSYHERSPVGSDIFIFDSSSGEIKNIPIKVIPEKIGSLPLAYNIDSIYRNPKSFEMEFYLTHDRLLISDFLEFGYNKIVASRIKWNGKELEQRLLSEGYGYKANGVPIEVNYDLMKRGEQNYQGLERGEVVKFKNKNYFICTNNIFYKYYLYRCNSEDYDCELLKAIDFDDYHLSMKFRVFSRWNHNIIKIGEGKTGFRIKVKK